MLTVPLVESTLPLADTGCKTDKYTCHSRIYTEALTGEISLCAAHREHHFSQFFA